MNRVRRKEIEGVIASLESIQLEIERQAEIIGSIGSDEEVYRDNMPENLEGSGNVSSGPRRRSHIWNIPA